MEYRVGDLVHLPYRPWWGRRLLATIFGLCVPTTKRYQVVSVTDALVMLTEDNI